ncbi:Similar to imidazole glycerol phosphate synthase cyclase subunit (LPS cluster) [Olavius sp. associated proteobacterium Delta 1]|nr:Similar to imidazole glycerol phosphate synthase cyclase subunit (LPS cluster) [Olavius sp. associated proteobacterium Delta 1]
MLKTRLIPVLYIMNGLIVRSEGFSYHQNIGNVINEASRYNEWDVDELIYIDISRTGEYDLRRDDLAVKSYSSIEEIIQKISKVCFMPLTFGGGIRSLDQIDMFIRSGADKVTLNTGAFENPRLINKASLKYGAQCIVISIDYRIIDSTPIVFTQFGQHNTQMAVYDWIKQCEDLGAGEIFLNSIDRDGKADGYDEETMRRAAESIKLPVIACGGAGDFYDFVDLVLETGVAAAAAGNIFHFTENSYPRAKKLMKKEGCNVR